jgi:tetratricopeptide (TPR) repeat protein
MHQGQVEPAFEHYQAALAAAEQTGDKVELAVVHENLGANHYRGGEFAAARAELSQAIDLYRDSVGEVRAILALQILSRVSLAQGYLDEAITTIEQAEAIALEAGDRWRAECHQARGAVLAVRGEWQSAKDCLERAVATHEQVGHPVGLIESLVELGSVYEQIGEWSEACAGARRALELSRSLDPCPVTVSVKAHLGRVLLKQGALADATAQIEQALALARTMPRSLEYAPALLAMAELAHGVDPTRAIRYGKQALERARTAELMWQAHMFLAMAYCAAGDGAASVRHVACAARLAEQTRSWWLSDQVSRMRVTIADLMGWTGGEDAALAEAQAWHGETGPLSLATS